MAIGALLSFGITDMLLMSRFVSTSTIPTDIKEVIVENCGRRDKFRDGIYSRMFFQITLSN